MMHDSMGEAVGRALGKRAVAARPLSGGCVAEVQLVTLPDGVCVVAKRADARGPVLEIEARTLRWLRDNTSLPTPEVLHSEAGLLILEYVAGSSRFDDSAERHAAELLADLHGVAADRFGFAFDTALGGLVQPNESAGSWVGFFRDRRLLWIAGEAAAAGRITDATLRRVERLAARLESLIDEPERPSLLHGDVWAGNVLAEGGRIRAFLDPAAFFGHPEAELSFITLFGTFGPCFFDRYTALRPIRPGFFERRRTVYNLVPLLVHARLFGGAYEAQACAALSALGA